FALLFDMNKLWEEYVYQKLKAIETQFGFHLHAQSSIDFWKMVKTSKTKSVKPDLLLDYSEGDIKKRVIVDTKWKCPVDEHPTDEDLKQMLVYKLYYHADEAILFYPGYGQSQKIIGA